MRLLAVLLFLFSTGALGETLTLTSRSPETLSLDGLRAKCPVSLELTLDGQRVGSLRLSCDPAQITGDDAKQVRQFVLLNAPLAFTSTEVKLKPLPEEEVESPKGLLGPPRKAFRSWALTAQGTVTLGGKERKVMVKGVLTRGEPDAFSAATTTVRLEVPALRRADFGLATELPRPRVETVAFPLLLVLSGT